jgi:RNA polymerase sigma-70 factor, ECF subfamily
MNVSVGIFRMPPICSVFFSDGLDGRPLDGLLHTGGVAMSSFPTGTVADFLLSSSTRERVNRNTLIEREVLGLFDLMRTRLLYYALSFGIPVEDGEDVVQEAFLALFRHLQMARSRENLQGWLFQVTHHLALKRRLKVVADAKKFDPEQPEGDAPDPNPEELVLFQERHARLGFALRALPQVDQSCLRLRAEGLRYREISKILGISLGSVSASLVRSLARLEQADRR